MKIRTATLIATLLSSAWSIGPADAQTNDYDRLKNILEDKFQPDGAAKPATGGSASRPAPPAPASKSPTSNTSNPIRTP